MNIQRARLINLRLLVAQYPSQRAFAKKVKKSQSYLSRVLNPRSDKCIGNKFARDIEKALGLEFGELDWEPDSEKLPLVKRERKKLVEERMKHYLDVDLLTESIREVFGMLEAYDWKSCSHQDKAKFISRSYTEKVNKEISSNRLALISLGRDVVTD
jgi:hypothetical protein